MDKKHLLGSRMADQKAMMFKEETSMISDTTVMILALVLNRFLLGSPSGHFDTFLNAQVSAITHIK